MSSTEAIPIETITTETRRPRRGRAALALLAAGLLAASCSVPGTGQQPNAGAEASATPSPGPGTDVVPTITYKGRVYPSPGPGILLDNNKIRTEIAQAAEVHTFVDYQDASNPGPVMEAGQGVGVDCYATGPVGAAPSNKTGQWYHLTGPLPFTGYFAATNAFENGDTTGPLSSQPVIDPVIPPCPVETLATSLAPTR